MKHIIYVICEKMNAVLSYKHNCVQVRWEDDQMLMRWEQSDSLHRNDSEYHILMSCDLFNADYLSEYRTNQSFLVSIKSKRKY